MVVGVERQRHRAAEETGSLYSVLKEEISGLERMDSRREAGLAHMSCLSLVFPFPFPALAPPAGSPQGPRSSRPPAPLTR